VAVAAVLVAVVVVDQNIKVQANRQTGMHTVAVVAVEFSPVQVELVELQHQLLVVLVERVRPLVALVQTILEAQPQVVVDGVHLAVQQWALVVLAAKLST
jgi:hypothetical protein